MSSSDASVVEATLRIAAEHPSDLLVVAGPTASGKTALCLELARRLGGEIVSADSVQVYKWFDIGSGKPTPEELRSVPHHLMDCMDPMTPMDAAGWATAATQAIAAARARGAVPIVCGGTFLWIKALVFGLARMPAGDSLLRVEHARIAGQEGRGALHARLAVIDPEAARRLHPNDLVRVSRALEVFQLTGKPLSSWHGEHRFAEPRCPAQIVALKVDPSELTSRIRDRARVWLANGWVEEVQSLLARGYGAARAMGSVGYAQVRDMIGGTLPALELEDAIVRATRVFARRQRTWLRDGATYWL